MSESTVRFCTVKIKSMNGRYASEGVNIAAGRAAKMKIDDVCKVPVSIADALAGCDLIERTNTTANCELVNGVIERG